MKFSIFALAFAAVASAGALANVPACAAPCLNDAAKQAGCGTSDTACICRAKDKVQGSATSCVQSKCDKATQQQILAQVQNAC